jgi:glycosyltransferase involved in cell wall biosynthesis
MSKPSICIHLTNVAGTGAIQLLKSLLPSLESQHTCQVKSIYLPDRGELCKYLSANQKIDVVIYRRKLPNVLSRLFECIFTSSLFDKDSHLLVLGDLPLRVHCSQTVFVQTSHLLKPKNISFASLKYIVSRAVFKFNLSYVNSVIVQTSVMSELFKLTYPRFSGKVYVVLQPVPNWLLKRNFCIDRSCWNIGKKLTLFYPAAYYPHKNHKLLNKFESRLDLPIEHLILTIDPAHNPAHHLSWLRCVGPLTSDEMIAAYSKIDGLLFLSKEESYGFPLVEAMHIGLPIICPDLPYARFLCGAEAIYFDPNSQESLKVAVNELFIRLNKGWWPDWRVQLSKFPRDWDVVARRFIDVVINSN